jgi:hypothetical protein
VKVNRSRIEKDSRDYDEPTDEDMLPLETYIEDTIIEKTQFEGMHPTEVMSPVQMSTARTKKLKTDREDPATKIRNRSKTWTRNACNKSTQP